MQFADCVEPKDCTYAEWEAWSPCSLTCGGGQKTAVRRGAPPQPAASWHHGMRSMEATPSRC